MGTIILYTMDENYFYTETFELPQYVAKNVRKVSGVQVGDGATGGDGIYIEDGLINTGHISSQKQLPFKDQKIVIDERKQLGTIYRGNSGARYGDMIIQTTQQLIQIVTKQIKEQNQKYKIQIKTLKR